VTGHLVPPDRRDERWSYRQAAFIGVAALAAVAVLVAVPPSKLLGSVFGDSSGPPARITPAREAFGLSGSVRVQMRLPSDTLTFPLDSAERLAGARYQWVRASDSGAVTAPDSLTRAPIRVPETPGIYHLAITTGAKRSVVGDIVLAVLVPFSQKVGASLNGYRIGTYTWERARGDATPPPPGFVEIEAGDAGIWVSEHLQLADFITHDNQEQWPRYVALDRRILDKVELVLDRLGSHERELSVSVHSGYRTPLHNRRVPRAASDSRHQYGDAIDLAVDADGDGRVSFFDVLAIAHAVDLVELEHPELVGGMGIYGNHGNAPYVHIDVRGEKKRWRG
jgi:uncharacterized protein YcbK (DUF882 family)